MNINKKMDYFFLDVHPFYPRAIESKVYTLFKSITHLPLKLFLIKNWIKKEKLGVHLFYPRVVESKVYTFVQTDY